MKTIRAAIDPSIALVHALDDKEKLRARVQRRLSSDLILLQDAYTANSRIPPKAHIVADHLDRVIKSLQEEVKKLKADR